MEISPIAIRHCCLNRNLFDLATEEDLAIVTIGNGYLLACFLFRRLSLNLKTNRLDDQPARLSWGRLDYNARNLGQD